jgi:hypothetical protein
MYLTLITLRSLTESRLFINYVAYGLLLLFFFHGWWRVN